MSNLSDIGFNVETEEDFRKLMEKAYGLGQPIKPSNGTYVLYSDKSGAELWMQLNRKDEFIGANPHFKGKSKRTVCLTATVDRHESELDGAYHSRADPTEGNNPDSGAYPLVFDIPDFRTIAEIVTPKNVDIQLVAFAQELSCYDSERAFNESQYTELKFASQSFIPSGLFSPNGEDTNPPEALGIFTGIIREWEMKTNELTGEQFYWLFVDTLGGEVDVVADPRFFDKKPNINGVVQGQFWLSGRLIDAPKFMSKKKGLFSRLYGK
ncbi:hypothetical protein C900_01842 [Fulvivirga imtechensis AK7]|uniref:Uncharacterized protein n=1 Tax=Fulvivirga imtechensis AK7 TaxID=1237149 RepID=L8JTE1_9BACT|nr:hypothetical protein [Fulvivirga imtechensis]ELR72100.1 hypothetical protein C900_01842 [Fulvivirga imtechensis AK7]